MSKFKKILPMGAEFFRADGRTRDEANTRCSQFCERAKNHQNNCEFMHAHLKLII